MKKFLVAALALASVSAFAQKHMVTLSGYETGNIQNRTLDLNLAHGGSPNERTQNIALNYAYAVTDTVQVGASYKMFEETESDRLQAPGDKNRTIGFQVIYNFKHQLIDTCYAALHYDMKKNYESETVPAVKGSDVNTWGLEYGHRFGLGKLAGMHFTYSPSATLSFAKTDSEIPNTDDQSTTSLSLNFVKFDVLF